MNVKEMIYTKEERIFFSPDKLEYDITDYIGELIEELEKLKRR
ncbi:TPA: hypothetical protein ACGOWR_002227 [Streptococcus suis]